MTRMTNTILKTAIRTVDTALKPTDSNMHTYRTCQSHNRSYSHKVGSNGHTVENHHKQNDHQQWHVVKKSELSLPGHHLRVKDEIMSVSRRPQGQDRIDENKAPVDKPQMRQSVDTVGRTTLVLKL